MTKEEKRLWGKMVGYVNRYIIMEKRVKQLEMFIDTWKDVLLTNMTEEDFRKQLKK